MENRLTNHLKLIELLPACRSCGTREFEQKELRKTGVQVKGNQVFYTGVSTSSDVGFVCCQCGKLMPQKDAIKVAKSPTFKSLFQVLKPRDKSDDQNRWVK